MYYLSFEVKDLPKRVNQIGQRHYFVRKKEKDKWLHYVKTQVFDKLPPQPLMRARITCVRYSSVCPDYDGLVSSFKYVLDALVNSGVIVDDRMDVIGMPKFRWEKAPRKEGKIVVMVESAEQKQ